jgi:hypothetical protein
MNDETPRRIEARRGFSVVYQGKTLLSRIDPEGQAERAAEAAPVLRCTLYFCPSPLYGYGLARLLERIGEDSAVLCVEADERLMALSEASIDRSLRDDRRLGIVGTGDAARLCAYVRKTWGSRRFRRIQTLRLSGGWQLNPALYEDLAAALGRDLATDWGNAMTLVKLGRRYARNALRNLTLIPQTRRLGELEFGGAPVLVLGAGPSLDGILDGLAEEFSGALEPARRPFRVICVDTALSSLRARNIEPDLAVALESQHWNLRDFIGLGEWKFPVAMDLSALPATGELLGGRPLLFVTPWTELSFFKRLGEADLLPELFPPLGSVGLTAVALARRLSPGSIITGGIDFSFTPDQLHARSSPGHLESLRRQTRFRGLISGEAFRPKTAPARSTSGGAVRSGPAMRIYRNLFEEEFSGDPRIYSIAGTGLPLGIPVLTLQEALDLLAGGKAPAAGKDAASFNGGQKTDRAEHLREFIGKERAVLGVLRDRLTGPAEGVPARRPQREEIPLETLLDRTDYLWAHFPECAGAGGRRPPASDLSFLKRVRAEIDPFLRLWDLVDREAAPSPG